MRRVVVTGMGIISCLGNSLDEVTSSLKTGKSGIRFSEAYKELGFRSQICGTPDVDTSGIDRKARRFMADSAMFSYLSMQQAIEHAGLTEDMVSNDRTGLIAGSGGASCSSQIEAVDTMRAKGVKRIGPYMVPRIMASTVSACLATAFKIRGVNYSMSSACATSAVYAAKLSLSPTFNSLITTVSFSFTIGKAWLRSNSRKVFLILT